MSPRIRIRRLIQRLGRLERDAAASQRRLLAALRREILAELASAAGFRHFQLQGLLLAVDRNIAAGRNAAQAAAAGHAGQAWSLGAEIVAAGVATPAAAILAGVSDTLLQAVIEVTRDQVRAVWSELGTRLKVVIRRAVLGVDDPFTAMGKVAKLIKDPKTFASAEARAEAIVRTEVNRTFSVSSAKQADAFSDAATRVGKAVKKWWVSAEDDRVRPDHVDAASRYTQSRAIPVDEPFIVGDEALRYPLDPQASVQQTINCRCVALYAEA